MQNQNVIYPFKTDFLADFVIVYDSLYLTDAEILKLQKELNTFEQAHLNPETEQVLITKNEILASFAISKAENSQLTLAEANNVYEMLLVNPDFDFIGQKLKASQELTQKDYDKLEFLNIAKTLRRLNQQHSNLSQLNSSFILDLHLSLTQGMDIFNKYLVDFTVYRSGKFRNNNEIRVGSFIPAPAQQIEKGVSELIDFVKKNLTLTGIAQFHTALYALHPFNNGNKRVCRVLEHWLYQTAGINNKNLYSPAYYAHIEKLRYYKYLLFSLERHNLNHFVNFCQEALVLSMMAVIKASIEAKRSNFLEAFNLEENTAKILKPLIKRREIQFKQLIKMSGNKMARQTFVDNLNKAIEMNAVVKRDEGKKTYYTLPVIVPELALYGRWLTVIKKKLPYIPDSYLLA